MGKSDKKVKITRDPHGGRRNEMKEWTDDMKPTSDGPSEGD